MPWKKLIFKQNQPIHIGSGRWGVLKETDIFIYGQTMWGALTNTYFQKTQNYDKTLFEKISNFFPSLDGDNILKPHYIKGEFHLGDFSEKEFRAYFVDTLVQTAVEPISRKATDESLHEIDYILPRPKREFQNIQKLKLLKNQLLWIGIIDIEDNGFLEIGLRIYVGADSRYGYGELELIDIKDLDEKDKEFWWIDGENIKIKEDEFKPTPYFIEIRENMEFVGEVILLSEFNFQKNSPEVVNAKYYITVGSIVKSLGDFKNKNLVLTKGRLCFNSL
mgnify:CR=1 FL=1